MPSSLISPYHVLTVRSFPLSTVSWGVSGMILTCVTEEGQMQTAGGTLHWLIQGGGGGQWSHCQKSVG